jgi:hypothetical protein
MTTGRDRVVDAGVGVERVECMMCVLVTPQIYATVIYYASYTEYILSERSMSHVLRLSAPFE